MHLQEYNYSKRFTSILQFIAITAVISTALVFTLESMYATNIFYDWSTGQYSLAGVAALLGIALVGILLILIVSVKSYPPQTLQARLHIGQAIGSALLLSTMLLFYLNQNEITAHYSDPAPSNQDLQRVLVAVLAVVAVIFSLYLVSALVTVWLRRRAILQILKSRTLTEFREIGEIFETDTLSIKQIAVDFVSAGKLHGEIGNDSYVPDK